MPSLLSAQSLKAFFDANPTRYKATAYGVAVQADGYLPSSWLDYQLTTPDSGANRPNPVTVQPSILKTLTVEALLGAISNASAQKVLGSPSITKLVDSILQQDRAAVGAVASFHATAGNITSAELTAVGNVLAATQPDPIWAANLPISDLEANFVDGKGNVPLRLQLAQNANGSLMAPDPLAFINGALGRSS